MTTRFDVLLRSEQSGDALAVTENTVPAGWGGPPLHHHDFDETFYVLDGELTFQLGDEVSRAAAGTLVFAPRGSHHTLANHGTRAGALPPGDHASRLRALLRSAVGGADRRSAAARVAEALPGDDGRRAADRPHALSRLVIHGAARPVARRPSASGCGCSPMGRPA